jgi:hypothetical protein
MGQNNVSLIGVGQAQAEDKRKAESKRDRKTPLLREQETL